MQKLGGILIVLLLTLTAITCYANSPRTKRIPCFSNDKVNVWKTIIYPSSNQQLVMHRHDYNRVVVALDDGKLKIVNNKGQTHFLMLKKNRAYFLSKDTPGELHTDENMSHHVIKTLVIELKH